MISATYIASRWRGRGKRNMKRQPPSPDAPPRFSGKWVQSKRVRDPSFHIKRKRKRKRKREREKEKER